VSQHPNQKPGKTGGTNLGLPNTRRRATNGRRYKHKGPKVGLGETQNNPHKENVLRSHKNISKQGGGLVERVSKTK